MKAKRAVRRGNPSRCGILLGCLFVLGIQAWGQKPAAVRNAPTPFNSTTSLAQFVGLPIRRILFQGVTLDRLKPLTDQLDQAQGQALSREYLKKSIRQLYATGLFDDIQVEAQRESDGVDVIFRGTPRTFIGTVSVDGAKGATINTQLARASQLQPGTRFTQVKLAQALESMRRAETENGFPASTITQILTSHPEEQLVDIAFKVVSGPQARVANVEVTGDPGMSAADFRHSAHLKAGLRVNHDTGNRALTGVLKRYRKQHRLEAEIKLESSQFVPASHTADYRFSATRGPIVKVLVQGISMNSDHVKHVIPIFEEGTVDEDLLNEGNRRLRDYFQRLGYFDVKVDHERQTPDADQVLILYTIRPGQRRRVDNVSVAGNTYFNSQTLKALLSVRAADTLDRHGLYSQALVAADVGALQAVYQNNGFSKVKIIPETNTSETRTAEIPASEPKPLPKTTGKPVPLTVVYRIQEGSQQRVGSVQLEGNAHVDAAKLIPEMNTAAGQLLSPQNLAGDRDALLTDYLSRGFDQARVDVTQQIEPADPSKVDVTFHVSEGQQIFVRKVLLTGLHYTRPDTVARAIALHPGDPLNQTALSETQRNLYDFALFNEVDTAVENPTGGETYKTILLQAVEARRWALTYGFGFEAQTGTPQNNCKGASVTGTRCNPNGKTGVSPRVLLDITRNSLLGREQSASLRGTYGLLEQRIDLLFQNPHFEGNRNFGLTFSGGYANSQDVTTYVAARLQAGARLTESFLTPGSFLSKANTLVYEYNFRRVKVAASSLQVFPDEIPLLSTAARVAGPGVTWIRDTRDSALDAHRGTYTSFQEFLSGKAFGAEAEFNRIDLSNSSFYSFNKGRFVLARNTRYGQVRAFGTAENESVPLPERLYAGGPTSLRGFSVNAAGPRDPETGFPIGGAGALINSAELRLPPPSLPWLGDSVSFVLFHDMGNVFTNASDAWISAARVHQPNRDTCKVLNDPADPKSANPVPDGPPTSTGIQGKCAFNYFSHTPGVGLRYHTPVGPIRLDFSYNLNPPIYPINIDYSLSIPDSAPHVGEAQRFNFFFSLGQTF